MGREGGGEAREKQQNRGRRLLQVWFAGSTRTLAAVIPTTVIVCPPVLDDRGGDKKGLASSRPSSTKTPRGDADRTYL